MADVYDPQGLVNAFRRSNTMTSPFSQATSPSLGTQPVGWPGGGAQTPGPASGPGSGVQFQQSSGAQNQNTSPSGGQNTQQPNTTQPNTQGGGLASYALANSGPAIPASTTTNSTNAPPPSPLGRFSNIRYYDPNTQQFFNESRLPVNSLSEFRNYIANPSVYTFQNEIPQWLRNLIRDSPLTSPVMRQAGNQGFRGNILNLNSMAPNAIEIDPTEGLRTALTAAQLNGAIQPLQIANSPTGSSLTGYQPIPGSSSSSTGNNTTTTGGSEGANTATTPTVTTPSSPAQAAQLRIALFQMGVPLATINALIGNLPNGQVPNLPIQGGATSLQALSDATRAALGLPTRAQIGF